jgi:hypothetical protein
MITVAILLANKRRQRSSGSTEVDNGRQHSDRQIDSSVSGNSHK